MPPAIYSLGEPAAAGEFEVTVTAVSHRPAAAGCDARSPCVQVTVNCTVRNVSHGPVLVSSLPAFSLIDPTGHGISPVGDQPGWSNGAASAGALRLKPGDSVRRALSFQVAADAFEDAKWVLRVGGPLAPRIMLR